MIWPQFLDQPSLREKMFECIRDCNHTCVASWNLPLCSGLAGFVVRCGAGGGLMVTPNKVVNSTPRLGNCLVSFITSAR